MATKAYWTLYIDILCIALDGNAFDTACTAMISALKQTVLPKAWWDPDREMIICSPRLAEATKLRLSCLPVSSTFAVYSTTSPLKLRTNVRTWTLADPDGFEEEVTTESLTITFVLTANKTLRVIKVEKSGGSALGKDATTRCIRSAEERCKSLSAMLNAG